MIRLASVAPLFKHGGKDGVDLTRSWASFESLTGTQVEILRKFHGRWIRLHPDDRDQLARYGLAFVAGDEPLAFAESKVELATDDKKKAQTADDKKNTNTKAKADKADEKKG